MVEINHSQHTRPFLLGNINFHHFICLWRVVDRRVTSTHIWTNRIPSYYIWNFYRNRKDCQSPNIPRKNCIQFLKCGWLKPLLTFDQNPNQKPRVLFFQVKAKHFVPERVKVEETLFVPSIPELMSQLWCNKTEISNELERRFFKEEYYKAKVFNRQRPGR